jgi:hypothetical protein
MVISDCVRSLTIVSFAIAHFCERVLSDCVRCQSTIHQPDITSRDPSRSIKDSIAAAILEKLRQGIVETPATLRKREVDTMEIETWFSLIKVGSTRVRLRVVVSKVWIMYRRPLAVSTIELSS